MTAPLRMSAAKVKVLQEFLDAPEEPHYGYALMRSTGVRSGTLYPILEQVERVGWVEASWEDVEERTHGRPPRRWYRLTGEGQRAAGAAIERYLAAAARPRPLRPAFGVEG